MTQLVRYEQLTDALATARASRLVEVGTWNGERAQQLAAAALRNSAEVTYDGFDLFEALTDTELEEELSKRPPSRAEVEQKLSEFRDRVGRRGRLIPSRRRKFDFSLHQGYTRDSLPEFRRARPDFQADFVFIDGGHKIETIENDWTHTSPLLAPEGELFLDDYYGDEELAERFGCNQLIERLRTDPAWNVEVMAATDDIPSMGTVQIAKVTRAA